MKFSASRSLLHGTVALFARAQGVAIAADLRRELQVALGQPEAAGLDDLEVARLGLEHVEVVAEGARPVQAAAGRRDHAELVAGAQSSPRSSSFPR